MLRKFGLIVAVATILFALPGQSKAGDLPSKLPIPMPSRSAPVFHAGGGGAGLVSFVAIGIIGVAAAMCAYDIYLKIEGLKNWDGTPKIPGPRKH
jgi:hypothetical protein